MTRFQKGNANLFSALDRFVRVTGLYRMTMIERPEPRSLRWMSALVLLAFPLGYAMMIMARRFDFRSDVILSVAGLVIFFSAYGASFYLRYFGPRLIEDPRHPLDERERGIRDRAGYLSGALISFAAMIGCFYFGVAGAIHAWQPDTYGWMTLGLAIQGIYIALPVLVASWLQPRLSTE